MAKTLIQWQGPEFERYEKSKLWFVIVGLCIAGLIALAIWMKSYFMIATFALIGIVLFLFSQREPRQIKFAITSKGIMAGKKLFRFDDLKSFWIFYDPPEIKNLSLISKKTFMPQITIPLGRQNPVELRKILMNFLPEKEQEESALDSLARKLKL